MPKVDVQKLRDCSEGIVQSVDTSIAPSNSVYLGMNMLFHKNLGRAVLRDGTTLLGAQVIDGKSCLGLYQHIDTSGVEVPLAVFNIANDATASIYKYTSSTWSSAHTGLAKDTKVNFETFLDTTVAVNGQSGANATTDGATWVSSGGNLDVGNMPAGKYVIEFKDRIYTAGVSGYLDRLYYSSTPTDGAISWDDGYIDIEPEEGAGAITGLAKVPGYLLVFKERSIKRWDTQSTYPESLITIGAPSQSAIVQTKQTVFYYNQRGIYETIGGYPRKISRRIQDIIDAIPSSYYSSVSGWGDGENVYWSIGDITLDDLTLTNCVIAYHIDSRVWALFSMPTEPLVFSSYVGSNGKEEIIYGDDDGNVFRFLQGDDDNSADINWLLQYNPQEFGSRGRLKDISSMMIYSKKVRNGKLSCRMDGEGNFNPTGNISKNEQKITKDLRGRYFEFRLQGSSQEGVEFIGIDFPMINVNLAYE